MDDSVKKDSLKWFVVVPFSVLSITWFIAHYLKNKSKTVTKYTQKIKFLNWFWLGVSLTFFLFLLIKFDNLIPPWPAKYQPPCTGLGALTWRLLVGYFFWSRCTEIFIAFLRDAYDKIGQDDAHSSLKYKDRLVLAFKSYLELIFNFAIIYDLCPTLMWIKPQSFDRLTDFLYFSATTITTSGNGAIVPQSPLVQFLSTYEIFCGVVLLVVCFTIYTTRLSNNCNNGRHS